MVQACAGKIPSYMVPSVGEVFWEMLRYNKEVGDCIVFSIGSTMAHR